MSDEKAQLRTRLEKDVAYHPPDDIARIAHGLVREETLLLARLYVDICPAGRELSLALTKLVDEAMAHANAAIARNHAKLDPRIISDRAIVAAEGQGSG